MGERPCREHHEALAPSKTSRSSEFLRCIGTAIRRETTPVFCARGVHKIALSRGLGGTDEGYPQHRDEGFRA